MSMSCPILTPMVNQTRLVSLPSFNQNLSLIMLLQGKRKNYLNSLSSLIYIDKSDQLQFSFYLFTYSCIIMKCSRCYLQSFNLICGACYSDHFNNNLEGRKIVVEKHLQAKKIFQGKIQNFHDQIVKLSSLNRQIASIQQHTKSTNQKIQTKQKEIKNYKEMIKMLKQQKMRKKQSISNIKKQRQKIDYQLQKQKETIKQQNNYIQLILNRYIHSLHQFLRPIIAEIATNNIDYDQKQWNKLKNMPEQQIILCITIIENNIQSQITEFISCIKTGINAINSLSKLLKISLPYQIDQQFVKNQMFPFSFSQQQGWIINQKTLKEYQVNIKYLLSRFGFVISYPHLELKDLQAIIQKYLLSISPTLKEKEKNIKISEEKPQQKQQTLEQQYKLPSIIAQKGKIFNNNSISTQLIELYYNQNDDEQFQSMQIQVLSLENYQTSKSDNFQIMELLE